ncbi:hypothetical protein BH09ACT1_BH09ACT1_07160 [soil metagenome]
MSEDVSKPPRTKPPWWYVNAFQGVIFAAMGVLVAFSGFPSVYFVLVGIISILAVAGAIITQIDKTRKAHALDNSGK